MWAVTQQVAQCLLWPLREHAQAHIHRNICIPHLHIYIYMFLHGSARIHTQRSLVLLVLGGLLENMEDLNISIKALIQERYD